MPCKRSTALTMLAFLAVAGCSGAGQTKTDAAASTPAPANDGRCHSEQAQFTVGKPVTPALLEQAKVRSGAQTVRALKPNDMVTLDYRSERLNLNTDANGVVLRANCG